MFPNMEGIAASYTQQPMHNGEFGVIMMRWADLISSLVGRKPWGWWEWLKAKCCWNGVQVLRKTPICWSFSFGWSYTVIFQSLGESEDPLLPFLSPSSSLSLSLHININWGLFVNSPMKFTLKVSTTNLDPQKPRFDYNELLLLYNIYVLSFGSSITRTVLAATNSVILISKYCPLACQ